MKGYWLAIVFVAACGAVSEMPDASVPTVTVTVVKDGNGGGSVTSSPSGIDCGAECVAQFEVGAAVVLTATPESGSLFMGWGGGCSGANSCVFTANSNNAISATFAKGPVTLTVNKTGNGMGTVSSNPAGITCGATCSAMFAYGTMVTLTATPTSGQNIRWNGGSCTGSAPCTVNATATETINAQFTIPNLFLIDDSTDTLQKVTNLNAPALVNVGALGVGFEFGDCAYNGSDGMLYFIDGRPPGPPMGTGPTNSLYRVNPTTGAATLVGAHGVTDMFALGYHPPSNSFYGVGTGFTLYQVNPTTGGATLVGPTGYTNGLVWDSKRNQMIAVTSGGSFNTIDLTTGVQTPIPGAGQVLGNNNGIAYDPLNDLFWMSSYSGGISKFDPNNNYVGTNFAATGPHTCITYVP